MSPQTEQSRAALAKAHEVRLAQADLKKELRFGLTDLHGAFERPCVQSMEIEKLLKALPGVRDGKAQKALRRLHISPMRPVGQLTPRQRAELVEAMP